MLFPSRIISLLMQFTIPCSGVFDDGNLRLGEFCEVLVSVVVPCYNGFIILPGQNNHLDVGVGELRDACKGTRVADEPDFTRLMDQHIDCRLHDDACTSLDSQDML